ncbi:hypothetical protein [Mycolicibacterium arseniciresistens]|uniref:Secreted protein n=1 Tax=Mycolicibacterium arseniciresistens TaxID=3062257 RepID=A0ABT8UBC2_9MYCO|nr:hypothetical protein [Mycolicibacterium arseniciresistens]MDO3635071.1 hypothetical protein [Mycolicibacterium arseniciresistens]
MKIQFAARAVAITTVGLGLTLGASAVANGKPVWDIGVYDSCVTKADNDYVNGVLAADDYADRIAHCCADSGGVWVGGPISGWCTSPPPRKVDAVPIAPGATAGVSDEPPPGTPLPTPTPRPRPVAQPGTTVG